ncbi:MAG TPA: hypothetical protein VF204_11510 [Streptosporangiaceae bacterium]
MAQQGPPPRRHARPPAPDWADQPPAQDEADWQAQPQGWAEQQGQDGWAGQQPAPQAQSQLPAGWQQQPAPPGWPAPGASGAHAAPPADWQQQAAPADWQGQPSHADWPGQPAQEEWQAQPAPADWPAQPAAPADWPGQPAQAGWQGQPAQGEWPGQAPAAAPGWDAPAGNPAGRHSAEPGWAEPPAQAAHAAAPHAHAAPPQPASPGWAEQAPQAAGALDLADGDRIAWPEEPGPAPAEVGQAWRNVPVRRPGDLEDPDADELPPWAGLSIMPQRPARQGRTIYPQRGGGAADGTEPVPEPAGPGGLTRRAIATRARKARRKLIIGGISAIVAVCVGAIVWLFVKPSPPPVVKPDFVQTFQPGEMQSVPDACQVVTGTVLSQYMPGQPSKVHSASLNGKTSSQCTWTLDAKPVYRVLEVTNQAYAPSGLNPGNGSATSGAILAYSEAEQQLAHPAKSTHLPVADVSKVPGLGDAAFSAVQVIRRAGTVNDLVTLVVRDRNVLVTVALQGEQRAAAGGYGPVRLSELQAGTIAAARQALAALPQR